MNFKELVDAVSAETNVPAAKVRKVGLAMLEKFAGVIDGQDKFTSSVITLTGFTTPAKDATEGKPAKPERKFARMAIRAKKTADSAAG
jgi:hypothetical protein